MVGLIGGDGPGVRLGQFEKCARVGRAQDLVVNALKQCETNAGRDLIGLRGGIGHSCSPRGSVVGCVRQSSYVRTSLWAKAVPIGKLGAVNIPFPVRFVGSFVAAIVLAIVLYLGAAISVYLLAWILGLIESI